MVQLKGTWPREELPQRMSTHASWLSIPSFAIYDLVNTLQWRCSVIKGNLQAVRALHSMTQDHQHTRDIAAATLPALASLLECSSSSRCRAEVAGVLCQLAGWPGLRQQIAGLALPSLVSLLEDSGNPDGRTHAAGDVRLMLRGTGLCQLRLHFPPYDCA